MNLLKVSLLFLLALMSANCSQQLNKKYHDFLHAKEPFDLQKAALIYQELQSSFPPSDYRLQIFIKKLQAIRKHNS